MLVSVGTSVLHVHVSTLLVGLVSACTERMLRLRQARTVRQPRCFPMPCYALAPGDPSGKLIRVALQFDKLNRAQRCADLVLPFRSMHLAGSTHQVL